MSDPRFVHLRLHSEYSFADGIVRIDDAIAAAKADAMPALALTDLANLFGMVKFYKAAMGAGIKPICGADLWPSNKAADASLSRISRLARNTKAYRNPTATSSRGCAEGQSKAQSVIRRSGAGEAADGRRRRCDSHWYRRASSSVQRGVRRRDRSLILLSVGQESFHRRGGRKIRKCSYADQDRQTPRWHVQNDDNR